MPASVAPANTDRELWREVPGDRFSASVHVTPGGCIGIQCRGLVIVNPPIEWLRMMVAWNDAEALRRRAAELEREEW